MNTLFAKRKTETGKRKENRVINVYTEIERAKMLGFGGAFTEASAYNYSLLNDERKSEFMQMHFSKDKGLGYNFCRLHIGSCDFALDEYSLSYKEDLSDFSIERDKKYIIPMVKDALEYTDNNIFLFASPWSPPAFMKDNGILLKGGKLMKKYYQLYADYFVKFIEAYEKEGIKISALTVQNEPNAVQTWESCQWTGEEEAEFAVDFLRPALDKNGFTDVKIIIWDHNKDNLFNRANESFSVAGAKDAIWGVGFHWYSGNHFDTISLTRSAYPDKMIVETELCHGDSHDLTDEERAEEYAVEYCEDINHGANGICDWNLMLDTKEGGPFHCRNTGGCYSAVYYDNETGKIKKDKIFSVIEMFSKYISPEDISVATTVFSPDIHAAAVKKSDGRILVFIVNLSEKETELNIRIDNDKISSFTVPEKSVTVNEMI